MSEEQVYKKVGNRYKKVGYEFTGFPADGVWLVKDGSENCIMRMDDIGKKPIPFIDVMKHKKDVMDEVYKLTSRPEGYSNNDLVDTVLEYISNQIEYEKYI